MDADKKLPIEYVNNKSLLEEFKICKEAGVMSNKLAKMLMMICERYGKKGSYANYTYNEDMQAFAMMNLVKSWKSFNPEKSNNPFAYFTSCVTNSFLQYLNQERRHRNIRDALLVENGMDPSYTFTETYNSASTSSDDATTRPTTDSQQYNDPTDEATKQDSAIY